jgi:hypothetical protein
MNRIIILLKAGRIAAASLIFGLAGARAQVSPAVDHSKSDETLMHRGHDLWLATLKWVAEANEHLTLHAANPCVKY